MSRREFATVNPATGETVARYAETPESDLERALAAAADAQQGWARTSLTERAATLMRMAGSLRSESEALARLMAQEMGKPLRQGAAEVEKCAWVCEHYARSGPELLSSETIPTESGDSTVSYLPLGTVLAVMPWNFPLWQVVRFAAPTLVAGNAVLLKPAPNVAGCGMAIERLFAASWLPAALFSTVLVDEARVGPLIADPRVAGVTLTGSTRAGRAIGRAAGQHLKKVVLELGGSDPYLVLEDADLDLAAETCVVSRLINAGQSCIAAKRFIVVDAVRAEFTERCAEAIASRRAGDPADEEADLGPLARSDLRVVLERQMRESIAMGARVVARGKAPSGGGFYFPPTLLDAVAPGMPAFREETFGPLAAIVGARDEPDAIRLANATSYGLGAAVFTRDVARGRAIAVTDLQAGSCFVNDFVKSDPRLPFGGIRASGIGRELGVPGVREFVNIKTVVVRDAR